MNSIEEKLWDYIDGTCTTAEREAIDKLLVENEAYQEKYLELLALNSEMADMELDEPSMAFTYNVMENIRADYAKQPLKARVNSTIIKVIAGFFIVSISAMLIFALANLNWHTAQHLNTTPATPIKLPDFKNLLNGPIFKGFLFFDTILVLFLLDGFLRKRTTAKQA